MTWLMQILEDLPIRTASNKTLGDKAFSIAKNLLYHRRHASLVYNIFDKTSLGSNNLVSAVKWETMPNQELAEELHKVRKLKLN